MENNILKNQNYNAVDLFKFICAILVIIIHVEQHGPDESVFLIVKQFASRIAVPFFFIASGFFLYKKTSYDSFSFDYSKKYVLKILKLYCIWSVIYLPFTALNFMNQDVDLKTFLLRYVHNAFFAGSYGHLWYLRATAVAVLIISFLLKKKVKPVHVMFFAVVAYFFGLLGQSWFALLKPLQSASPAIWNFLKLAEDVIISTRNGFFFGFLFISIGMLIAFYDIRLKTKTSIIGLVVSEVLFIAEYYILEHFNSVRTGDMFLMLAPIGFFMFMLALSIKLKDNGVYQKFRISSSLIYFLHLGVLYVVKILKIDSASCFVKAFIVFIISFAASLIIIKISENKHFKWVKHLYS